MLNCKIFGHRNYTVMGNEIGGFTDYCKVCGLPKLLWDKCKLRGHKWKVVYQFQSNICKRCGVIVPWKEL